jgi:hypothetical protein
VVFNAGISKGLQLYNQVKDLQYHMAAETIFSNASPGLTVRLLADARDNLKE